MEEALEQTAQIISRRSCLGASAFIKVPLASELFFFVSTTFLHLNARIHTIASMLIRGMHPTNYMYNKEKIFM